MALRIMIVEDSPAMRTFIRRVIELSGFEVGEFTEASDSIDALLQLKAQRVDLLVTDISMLGIAGEELVRKMACHRTLHTILVIVVSSDSTRTRIQLLKETGAQGFVKKPFLPENLRDELKRVSEGAKHKMKPERPRKSA